MNKKMYMPKKEKLTISENISKYIFDHLIAVIYGIGLILSVIFNHFYLNSLEVPFTPIFNLQSTFNLLIILPIVIINFFTVFILLLCSSGILGRKIFKDFRKRYEIGEKGRKKTLLKMILLFHFPLFLLFLASLVSLSIFSKFPFMLCLIILTVVDLGITLFFLKKIKFTKIEILRYSALFCISWIFIIFLSAIIYTASYFPSPHPSLYITYFNVILMAFFISILNVLIAYPDKKIPKIQRPILPLVLGVVMIFFLDEYFNIFHKILPAIANIAGIREKAVKIIVTEQSCNIIKMRAPMIIVQEKYNLCQTSFINILFNMGEHCLIDPLQKNIQPFSIPCKDIKS